MKTDVVIVGAGPAGIFTAIELIKRGSTKKITLVEKGQSVEKRYCPKQKTQKCVHCKPYCHITTGFSGAGAFSDGKLSLSTEVGGDLPRLIGEDLARETIAYTDKIYLEFGEHIKAQIADIRKYKTENQMSMKDHIPEMIIKTPEKFKAFYDQTEKDLQACTSADTIVIKNG